MKRCLFPKGVAAALFAVSVLNGCNEGTENLQYVNLSQAACSFLGEDNTPLTITVDASPATWQATPNASWIKAERTDEHTLTLTADDNDTDQERKTTVTIQADRATQTIRINQLPKDSFFARYRKLDEFASSAMSPGGKYAGGYIISVAPDDSWQYSPVIIDVETEERYEFGPFPESLYFISQTIAITDQGLMFLSNSNGGQIAINTTGDIIVPEAPAGFQFQPEVQGSSADGRYWVGFAKESNGEEGLTWPLLWTDGVAEKLPMPAKNFRDEAFWYGIMARGISADGSVIYGTTWENLDFGMVYWKRDGGEWKVDYVGQDVHEIKPVKMLDAFGEEMDYNLASAKAAEACVWVEIRVYTREAVLVIPGLFIGIGQNLIRLVDFLEFFLSGFITGILIGVVFHGQLAVGLFDLGVGRVLLHAQYLVIISFVLICHSFSPQIRWATADRGGRAAPIKLYSAN